MDAGSLAKAVAASLLDFALPRRCPSCGLIVGDPHSFCVDCWRSVQFLGDPCCSRCGLPFPFEQGEDAQCGGCHAKPPSFDRMRAAVAYGEVARRVVLKLKYGGKPAIAETIAHFVHRQMGPTEVDSVLVPVPLHRWRMWKRGYNQSALIAAALARRTGQPVQLDALQRTRATPVLRGLGHRQRDDAVRGVFRVPEHRIESISGQNVTLVDDVYTSGATARACAKVLKRAGARRVNIVCWARVVTAEDR